jgi:hypothetical protein
LGEADFDEDDFMLSILSTLGNKDPDVDFGDLLAVVDFAESIR